MARDKMVTAVFLDRLDAEQALDFLHARGYDRNAINVLMSDKTAPLGASAEHPPHPANSAVAEGMSLGGVIGTAVGATVAAVAAIGTSIAIPFTGGASLILAGPIAAALAGGGAGAVTGGVLGALIGAGIPEANAEAYQEALRNGGVVIGVVPRSEDDAREIQERFKQLRGESVLYG
jgi:hypothetical protein